MGTNNRIDGGMLVNNTNGNDLVQLSDSTVGSILWLTGAHIPIEGGAVDVHGGELVVSIC